MSRIPDHKLTLISSIEVLQDYEDRWKTLLSRSEVSSVYLTWQYVTTWLQTYGLDYELRVIIATDEEDEVVGIAPMIIGPGESGATRSLRCLSFIGTLGDSASEFVDFIVEPGFEKPMIDQFYRFFQDELGNEWDLLALRQVESTSPSLNFLLTAMARDSGTTFRIDSTPSPFTTLPSSWVEYLGSRSKNFRKAFKGHWNRLHKRHDVQELVAGEDIALDAAMKHLLELNHSRWENGRSTFNSSQFYSHHLEIAKAFQKEGWLYFRLLEIDGQISSARFDFCYANKLWNVIGGWSPDYANLSLGRIAIAKELQWCIENGFEEYDFLGGEASYKRTWASSDRTLLDLVISNPRSFKAKAIDQVRCFRDFVRPRPTSLHIPLPLAS